MDNLINVLNDILDTWILTLEVKNAQHEKDIAVKSQDYDNALKWRNKEQELQKKLPTIDDLKYWKQKLNAETP